MSEELTQEIDTAGGDIFDGDIDQPAGNLRAAVKQATSGQGADELRDERSNRQATSDEFDPRSTLHRDSNTLEDDELGGDELEVDVEGNRIDKTKPPQPEGELAPRPAVAADPLAEVFAVAEAEGIDLKSKYRTPADAVKGLLHAHKLVGQRSESAQEWDRLVTDPARQREVYELLHKTFGAPPPVATAPAATAAPTPAAPAPAAAAAAANRPTPPKLPRGWEYHYENGQPKPNADPNVIAAVEEYRADRRMLQEDPIAYLQKYNAVGGPQPADIDKLVDEKLKALQTKQAEENERLRQQNEQTQAVEQMKVSTVGRMEKEGWFKWLYEPGYRVNGSNVEGKLTPDGERFNKYVHEAANEHDHGIPLYPTAYQRAMYARSKLLEDADRAGAAPPNGHAAPTNDPRLNRAPGGDVGGGERLVDYRQAPDLRTALRTNLRIGGASIT